MRRKAILLASVAAAALIAAQPASADGLYFSASGGASFIEDTDGTFTTDFFRGKNSYGAHFDPETGFLLATALGLELDQWLHGLKIELETSFRRNNVGGLWTRTSTEVIIGALSSGPIDGHLSTFALMANAWYEFNVGSRFKPYFGGGFGWARSNLNGSFGENEITLNAAAVNPFNGFSIHNAGFAYQLGFGLSSQIMPGVSLGLGYRFFDAPDTEIFFAGKLIESGVGAAAANNSNSINFDNESHSVALTLTIDVN